MLRTRASEDKLTQTMAAIEAVGGSGVMFVCDLSDPDGGRDQPVARLEAALGAPIDILVNVAAMGPYKKFEEIDLDLLQKTFELNVKAPWLLCRQVLGGMRAQGRGAIVNIGTKAAEYPVGPPYRTGVTAAGWHAVRQHQDRRAPLHARARGRDPRPGHLGEHGVAGERHRDPAARGVGLVARLGVRAGRDDGRSRARVRDR